ncbi:MAG: hypothetical protein JW883_12590 [Deltaproteobacteria bacterium]|nr:hypothetical protein [Deltaproteobacteria bacterium]
MKNTIEQLIEFAKDWGLELEVDHDVEWAGERVHRVRMSEKQGVDGNKDQVFFWVRCEQESLCFYGSIKTAEELSHTYNIEVKKLDWSDVPENKTAMCLRLSDINLGDNIHKEIIRYFLNSRAQDFGKELSMQISGSMGGCGGV